MLNIFFLKYTFSVEGAKSSLQPGMKVAKFIKENYFTKLYKVVYFIGINEHITVFYASQYM